MKLAHKYKPWIFLWLPWVGAVVALGFLVLQEPQGKREAPLRLVSREPGIDPAFLQTALPQRKVWTLGSAEAFLGRAPMTVDVPAVLEEPKEPSAPGFAVRVTGVFLGGRVRVSVINGVPYAEGSIVPEAGLVERVHKGGVTIVADNGKRIFVGVGKEVDL